MKGCLVFLLGLLVVVLVTSTSVPLQDKAELEYMGGFILYRNVNNIINYLLLQSIDDRDWEPPKGHIEIWEDEYMSGIRETYEETGYIFTQFWMVQDYVPFIEEKINFYYVTGGGDGKNVTLFPAKLTNLTKPIILNPKEHVDYTWVSYTAGYTLIKRNYRDALTIADEFIRRQEGGL